MKNCLFVVLLLAVSNAFEETSYFSTSNNAEIDTIESTEDHEEDHKLEIDTTEPIKDHKQSSLIFNLTSSFEKLNKLRNDLRAQPHEAHYIFTELINENSLQTLYNKFILIDFLLPEGLNVSNNIFEEEDLKNFCDKVRKTKIFDILSERFWNPKSNYTEIFLDEVEVCLRKLELHIKQSATDKLEINTTESTENHKLEINTERIEDHKPKINTIEPTEDHKPEISTTESTEDHKSEINTTDNESTEDHKPFSLSLTSALEKLDKLYPSAIASNFLDTLIDSRIKNSSYDHMEVLLLPLIDLLLPEGFYISELLEREEYSDNLENPCNEARMIRVRYYRSLLFVYYVHLHANIPMHDILSKHVYNTYNNIKACLQYLELHIKLPAIQKSRIQSVESNVDHEITASTLKNNSNLKVITEIVQTEHENKDKNTMYHSVPLTIFKRFEMLP